jgi:methylenetetrahydrofolate dehydrogenase (NADP+) / methenyltetrahydrofolate cyclohydrolase
MTARTLDGEAVASRIKDDLASRIASLRDRGVYPGLGTILVGDDGPSANYVAMKHRDCEAIGIESFHRHLPSTATQAEVEAAVDEFNDEAGIDAYLIQYPFPDGLDFEAALLRMDPAKDVDGLHPVSLGKLVMGTAGPRPCTPVGIVELLAAYDIDLKGQHVVVVGRGLTIGRPLANLLTLKEPGLNAGVSVVHTGVPDLARYTLDADVLIAAAGSPGLITADMVRPGTVVVAAGVTFQGRKIVSDVADDVAEVASWLSPRIGGVGPMTRAMLLSNCVDAAEQRAAGTG